MHAEENILLPQDNEFLPENAGTSDDGECAVSAPRAARRPSLKALFAEKKYLLLCFFVPAALMWLIYIALKTYPFGDIWEHYCETCGVPAGAEWFDEIKTYDKDVLSARNS